MNYVITTVLIVLATMSYCGYADAKSRKTKQADFLKRWNEELAKPKYKLVFTLQSGVVKESKPIKAWKYGDGTNPFSYIRSAKESSEQHKYACFKRGFFLDKDEVSYPSCNIDRVRIEEVK